MGPNDIEPLMVLIMNHFADRLATHAIVKGGMALRLIDCPRFTNDLDYVLVPFSSKKEVQKIVMETLREISGARVSSSINSKCLRCIVDYQGRKLQIEINAAEECPSVELSTATLARGSGQLGRMTRVMRFDHALAHKLAAWNERRLMRDLYDIYFLAERAGVKPDATVLKQRLAAAQVRVSGRTAKTPMTMREFCDTLNACVEKATREDIEAELKDYLTAEEMAGLEFKFRVAVKKTVETLLKSE
jgi:predicted nucleotidyltransferase component of viral defense system